MAKSEGPSIPNFMHQMLRVGHTEHTRTIIPWIGRTCEYTRAPSFLGLDAPVNEDNIQHFNSISAEINKVLL